MGIWLPVILTDSNLALEGKAPDAGPQAGLEPGTLPLRTSQGRVAAWAELALVLRPAGH